MRQGLVVLLGLVAFLGQSISTVIPTTQALLPVGGLGSSPSEPLLGETTGTGLLAGDRPNDDGNDLEEEGRNVTVEIRDGDVDIGLGSNTSDGGDEVKVQFGGRAAELRVSFETLTPVREEVEMRIEFRDLVEFEDRNGDGAFSPLNDKILQWLLVETLPIPKPPETGDFSVDSNTGQQINITYGFPGSATGTFDLIFRVFGLPTRVDGLTLGPTETKIDIEFTDFPFTSNTSQLALGLDVRTNYGLEMDPTLAFDQINATGDEFAAFFRWMPDAVFVDGIAAEAGVTVVRESNSVRALARGGDDVESELRLFLAYPRGSRIVHDPVVGIIGVEIVPPLPVPGPRIVTYAIGLATALVLVVGLWALHRRRS